LFSGAAVELEVAVVVDSTAASVAVDSLELMTWPGEDAVGDGEAEVVAAEVTASDGMDIFLLLYSILFHSFRYFFLFLLS
jgi:hypothetical protein